MNLKDYITKYGGEYIPIRDPQPLVFKLPNMAQKEDMFIWEIIINVLRKESRPLYSGLINNAWVCGDKGLIKANDIYLDDFGTTAEQFNTVADIKGKTCISLVDEWAGSNYWHWVQTSLARLSLVQNMDLSKCVLIVNSFQNNFVKDSLLAMGIDLKNCVELRGGKVFCEKLVVTSKIRDGEASSLSYLRSKLIDTDETSKGNRVYISRNKSFSRKIENEKEVFGILKDKGFILVSCEDMTFRDQVKLFSNADFVVGPHGAGMTNALFVRKNAKILEIRNRDYPGLCYYRMCNNLGIEYYNLYGVGHHVTKLEEFTTNLQGNIKVDIGELVKTLELMGV